MKILVVSCLKNDDDQEMSRMADSIEANLNRDRHQVTKIKFADLLENHANLEKNAYEQVYFAGHGRFLDENLDPIPLQKRTVGGYTCEEIAQEVYRLANKHMSGDDRLIKFFHCEIALSTQTRRMAHTLVDGVAPLVHNLTFERGVGLDDAETSCLWKICELVANLAEEDYNYGLNVGLQGLNGVGHLSTTDIAGYTFDQIELPLSNEIDQLECVAQKMSGKKLVQRRKEIEAKVKTLEEKIRTKLSPHQIRYSINMDCCFPGSGL